MRLSTSLSCKKNGQARSAMAKFWRWQSGDAAAKGAEFEIKDYNVPVSEASETPSSHNYFSETWETHKNPFAAHTSTNASLGDKIAEFAQFLHQRTPSQPAVSVNQDHAFPIHRDWRHASHSPQTPPQESFVITSFNVLASKLALRHRRLYPSVPSHLLAWNRRRRKVLEKLGSCFPDIICLQEVDQFKDLEEHLGLRGYAGLYKARTGEMPDGCAIFWRKERFQLLQEQSFEFSMLGMRDNVAQLCVLELIVPGLANNKKFSSVFRSEIQTQSHRLIVGNIHVLFNPKRGEIKLGQCRAFLEQVHNLSSIWHGAPVVIGGDFNSTPSSAVYKYLATSELDLSNLDRRYLSGLVPEVPSPIANKSRKEVTSGERLQESSVDLSTDELAAQKLQMGLQMAPSPERISVEPVGAVNQTNSSASLGSNLEVRNGHSKAPEQVLGSREQTSNHKVSMAAVLKGDTENMDASMQYTVVSLEEANGIDKTHGLTTNEALGARTRSLPTTMSCVSQECVELRPPKHVQTHSDSKICSSTGQCEYGRDKHGWDSEELRIATGNRDCTLMQHELNLYRTY